MKCILLFDLIWSKTVENATDLKLMMFDGWVWTVLHLVVFLGVATAIAHLTPIDAIGNDRSKRKLTYFSIGLLGLTSLFSYHYFYAKTFITELSMQSRFVFSGMIYYIVVWVILYAIIVLLIYPKFFHKYNFGRIFIQK